MKRLVVVCLAATSLGLGMQLGCGDDNEETCGNGIVDVGETCDDGNREGGDGCSATCQSGPICGDAIREAPETCDDGNRISGDGCDRNCLEEKCGNGVIQTNEECDDGDVIAGDGCDPACRVECGNGQQDGTEECDDGNLVNGDGCSATCSVESVIDAPIDAPLIDAPPTLPAIMITEISYDPAPQWVEITNTTAAAIDLSGWQMCGAAFSYWPLPNVSLAAGDSMLLQWDQMGTDDPASRIYFTGTSLNSMGNGDVTGNDKSMAVYRSSAFTNPSEIVSFVQWVEAAQARSNIANAAGVWNANLTTIDAPANSSLCFAGGDPTQPSNWIADPTPTPNADNAGCN